MHIIGSRQMGGADQFYVRLVGALHDAGHRVTALNRKHSPIANALARSPVAQMHPPLANGWDLFSVWRIRQWVQALAPDIVQTYMGRATRLTRLPKKTRAVHIARLGGYYKIDGYYRHAHAWIGNTKGLCDYLVRQGLPAQRVFHISNFVPEPVVVSLEQLQALRERWRVEQDAIVLFTLGRLIDIKGFDDLLHAFAKLPKSIHGRALYLLIAGDGPLRDPLRALCTSLGLDERVRWLGWQDQPGEFFALADWIVCPSRYETLGNVILEAWSYGKPVVATAAQGPSELIDDGHTGLLAPHSAPAELAAKLQAALELPEAEVGGLIRQGAEKLRQEFSQKAIVNRYLDLYSTLAKR